MTIFPQCHFKPETGQVLLYSLIYIMKKYKTELWYIDKIYDASFHFIILQKW